LDGSRGRAHFLAVGQCHGEQIDLLDHVPIRLLKADEYRTFRHLLLISQCRKIIDRGVQRRRGRTALLAIGLAMGWRPNRSYDPATTTTTTATTTTTTTTSKSLLQQHYFTCFYIISARVVL
jgi:hypothetical protein